MKAILALPVLEQSRLLDDIKRLEHAEKLEVARQTMYGYTKHLWPSFIEGRHHRVMDEAFDRVIAGTCKRLIINMGPRHTKSKKASYLLPSKYLGHYPDRKIIQTSHTAELAVGFGRDVRNLVATEEYRELFPNTLLSADAKAAGRWTTSEKGEYFAIGVGGAVAGKGADLLIIDDPHSEQELMSGDAAIFDRVYDWYTGGPRQRLQPGGAIVVVMTRWSLRDLTGQIVKHMTQRVGHDQWEIIEFPVLFDADTDNPRALWPEFWPLEELLAIREELPNSKWMAQYMQNPTSEEGALVKKDWWQIWERDEPPECEYIIQSWDTAYKKTERSDYSACTTWGVFYIKGDDGENHANIILLDAFKERLEFPDLKRKAFQMWKERQPDAFIIEAKASGLPLVYELRQMGIPVQEFTPTRGNDKVVRVNAVSDLFSSGVVWCPQTRWAEAVMDEFVAFPVGEHDDLVDASTQALLRFRQGGFLRLHTDEDEEPVHRKTFSPY